MVEVAFRLQSAAGHQRVSDADGGCCLELYSDVKLIIFLQKGTGYLSELSGKVITGNIIGALQHGLHGIQMALLQLPQPGSAGMFTGSGVGNVKNIAKARSVPGIVHQSDSLGTAPYIAAHLFIPQIVLCTGGGVRSLGIDHQLLMERVLVKAGSSGEKPCPFLPAPRELCCHFVRHLCI
nr:hypothetical protein [Enterocloster bolteae]